MVICNRLCLSCFMLLPLQLPVSLHPLASPLLSDDSQPDGAGVNGNKTCSRWVIGLMANGTA